MAGQLDAKHVERPDIERLEEYLKSLWDKIGRKIKIDDNETPQDSKRRYIGKVTLQNGRVVRTDSESLDSKQREQSFQLELKSQVFGGATLLRCASPVGKIDLNDQVNLNDLYRLQYSTGKSKICAIYNPKYKKHMVTVEGDRLFDLKTTQWQEVEDLIVRTVEVADEIEDKLFGHDEDARYLTDVLEGQNK